MHDKDHLNEQTTLLITYRSTLSIYMRQRAMFGFAHTPAVVINSIVECREQIRRIKAYLRSQNLHVEDMPDDEEHYAARLRNYPYANLPQLNYFVGRDEELEWLKWHLSPANRTWLFLITGIGGVGKTALAQAIAAYYHEHYASLDSRERFDAIIWVSAKEDMLTAQGIQKISLPGLTVRTIEDIYTVIAQTLGREDILRALAEKQSVLINQALSGQRTLLIIDNLETVHDKNVQAFLQNLPVPTKAVITTREWLDVANHLRLQGLRDEHAETLILEETSIRKISIDQTERTLLVRRTAGLPLPIKLSVARLGAGQSFDQVTRWIGDAQGDLPEYCIRGQVNLAQRQDGNTWNILMTCALFNHETGASRDALRTINNLSIADCDEAIAILYQHSLIDIVDHDRITVLPITQECVRFDIAQSEENAKVIDNWISWLVYIASNFGAKLSLNMDAFELIRIEYPNLLSGVRWCYDQRRWSTLLDIAEGTWFYAHVTSLFNEFREILEYAIKAAQQINDLNREGFFSYWLGWLAPLQGESEEGRVRLLRAEEIALQNNNYRLLADVYYARANALLGHGERQQELFVEAETLLRKSLAISSERDFHQIKSLAASRLGQIIGEKGQHADSLDLLSIAEQAAVQIQWQHGLAWAKYRRGCVKFAMKAFGEASTLFNESLQIIEPWNERYLIADNKYLLAQVSAAQGDTDAARALAQEALEIFDRLGVGRKKNMVKVLIDSLAT
jgi:tetratricopeptide (TPR) repeat protein